jgi:uncharacterized protein
MPWPPWPALWLAAVLVLAFAAAATALDFPALSGRIVDQAGLLSPTERQSLDDTLAAHQAQTGNQVVVVTLRSLGGLPIEDYGYQLGRHWGIGEKGKDTGVLLIVAPNERKVRIEVGYGLEGTLTDATARLIIENVIVPAFRSGQFGTGIAAGVGAILKVLAGDTPPAVAKKRVEQRQDEASPLAILLVFVVIFFFIVMSRRGIVILPGPGPSRRERPWNDRDGWGGGGWGGGGGGWGGGGGGGFGGGGGSFGGGGASGSW